MVIINKEVTFMQFKKKQEIYNNKRIRFSKGLEEKIDKELEKVRKTQEANGNKTYTQEELDAMILGESYTRTI